MKTLIIPDIHEELVRLVCVLEEYKPQVDQVVFLGDFFDSFDGITAKTQGMITWLEAHFEDPKYIFLMGNHDVHYMYPNPRLRCSGFSGVRYQMLDSIRGILQQFKLFHQEGNTIFSHAGFHPSFLHQGKIPKNLEQNTKAALADGIVPDIMEAGWSRGGSDPYGGVVWLDWGDFVPVKGIRQVVGHTKGSSVRYKEGNVCLDTGLRHIGIIEDDGPIQIAAV